MEKKSLNSTGTKVFRLCVILLCTLATPLLFPTAGSCLPPGGGSFSLMNRYTDQGGSTTADSTLNESLFRVDLYQTVPGYGRLFLSTDISRTDSSDAGHTTSLSRYQLGLEGYRLGNVTTSFLVGDTNIRFTNLMEGFPGPYPSLLAVKPFLPQLFSIDQARFLNATYPDVNFRGGLLNSSTDRDSLLFFAGRLSYIRGFQANDIEVTDESLVGAKWTHKWSNGTYGGLGFIQTLDQPWQAGNPRGLTLNNSIFLLDGSYDLGSRVRLVGEYRQNFFTLNGKSTSDWAMKAGPMVLLPYGRLELNYRRVGPNFIFVGENLQADRDVEGVFASLDYKVHQNLNVYSSFDWNRSNLGNNTALPAVNTISALLGGYFFHPVLPSLNLRFALTDRSSRVAIPTPIDSRDYSLYLETLKAFKLATPYLRLQGEMLNDSASPLNSAKTGTATVGVRVTPLSTLNFYVEGEEQVQDADRGATTTTFRTKGGISYIPLPNISLHVDGEFSTIRDNSAEATSQKNYSFNGGAMVTLPRQYYINGDIRYNSARMDATRSTDASTLQFNVGLTKRFEWGRAGGSLSGQGTGVQFAEVGDIEGYVYQDMNRNGNREPREPGLAKITVLLEDNSKAVTNAEGRYRFSNVATGIHVVKLNERELDANINLLSDSSRRVEVKLRETTNVDYPVSFSGSMKGKVLVDANGNGTADPDDTPLPDILVYLVDTRINTFSDVDGNFALENLLPGRYEVRIDTTALPEGMKLISLDRYTVEIKSGDELKDLIFLVAPEKKEVRKKVFGTGGTATPGNTTPVEDRKTLPVRNVESVKQAAGIAVKTRKGTAANEKAIVPTKKAARPSTTLPSTTKTSVTTATTGTIPPLPVPSSKPVEMSETSVVEVHFRPSSTMLASDEDLAYILTVARMANTFPDMQLAIEGRTDQTGAASFNRRLGLKRANAVAERLITHDVPPDKISRIRSFGLYGLFCEEYTESCFAKNRRVVIRLYH